jgi:hypothetical protein
MNDIYAPVMRVLVVAALVLATATLMFVTVNTARATARAALLRAGQPTPVQALPASPERPAASPGLLNS